MQRAVHNKLASQYLKQVPSIMLPLPYKCSCALDTKANESLLLDMADTNGDEVSKECLTGRI